MNKIFGMSGDNETSGGSGGGGCSPGCYLILVIGVVVIGWYLLH